MEKIVNGNAGFLIGGMQGCMSMIHLENERRHHLVLQMEWNHPKYTPRPHLPTDMHGFGQALKLTLQSLQGLVCYPLLPAREIVREGTLGQEGDLCARVMPASNWLSSSKKVLSPL